MGYTHYYVYHRSSIPAAKWAAFTDEVKHLLANLPEHSLSSGGYHANDPLKLKGFDYSEGETPTQPVINKDEIVFNGDGEGLDHETFVLSRNWREEVKRDIAASENERQNNPRWFEYMEGKLKKRTCFAFTKTERKPYDIVVQAVLFLACDHLPGWLAVTSDGERSEWVEAQKLVSNLFKRNFAFPDGVKPDRIVEGEVHADGAVQSAHNP